MYYSEPECLYFYKVGCNFHLSVFSFKKMYWSVIKIMNILKLEAVDTSVMYSQSKDWITVLH